MRGAGSEACAGARIPDRKGGEDAEDPSRKIVDQDPFRDALPAIFTEPSPAIFRLDFIRDENQVREIRFELRDICFFRLRSGDYPDESGFVELISTARQEVERCFLGDGQNSIRWVGGPRVAGC
jgi:hypothetical protein